MSKVAKLLPLGTAVRIKNDDSHYILIARIFRKQETGEISYHKYEVIKDINMKNVQQGFDNLSLVDQKNYTN